MSDILNEYYKIAVEKGLIQKEAYQTREEKWSDKEYQDTIQALYGININDSKKSIIEEAHPDKVIIAPAYDKVNGLVENEQERHDIIVGLINRTPIPNNPARKIAEKELLDTLISLGFTLDSENQFSLRDSADECSIELVKLMERKAEKKQIKKEAIALAGVWAVTKGLIWAASVIGGVGAVKTQLFGFIKQGVAPDTERLVSELSDIQSKVGPQNIALIKEWISALNWFHGETLKVSQIMTRTSNVGANISDFDKVGIQEEKERSQADLKAMSDYNKIVTTVLNNLPRLRSALNLMSEQPDSTESEWWTAVKGLWHTVVGSDLDDAKNATDSLIASLKDYTQTVAPAAVQKALETQSNLKEQMEAEAKQAIKEQPKQTTVPAVQKTEIFDPEQTEDLI